MKKIKICGTVPKNSEMGLFRLENAFWKLKQEKVENSTLYGNENFRKSRTVSKEPKNAEKKHDKRLQTKILGKY